MNAIALMMLETAARLIEGARLLAAPETDARTFFSGHNSGGRDWLTMVTQFQEEDATAGRRPFREWVQGVLPAQVGDGGDWLRRYVDYRPMMQNAESAGVIVPIPHLVQQGEAAYRGAVYATYYGPWGTAWLTDPRTEGMRPKVPPTL